MDIGTEKTEGIVVGPVEGASGIGIIIMPESKPAPRPHLDGANPSFLKNTGGTAAGMRRRGTPYPAMAGPHSLPLDVGANPTLFKGQGNPWWRIRSTVSSLALQAWKERAPPTGSRTDCAPEG